MTRPRIGLLVIRAWIEPGSSSPLRAQIHRTTDVSRGFDRRLTVAEKEAVVAAVQAWISQMLAGSLAPGDDPDGRSGIKRSRWRHVRVTAHGDDGQMGPQPEGSVSSAWPPPGTPARHPG